ncbi:MAG TPA: hypothetical protein VIC26_07830 [Marinagarivorans sp.]
MTSSILILLIIFGALGASLFFIGWLFTFLTALGNQRYLWGALSAFIPPVALLYSALHWQQTAHAGKMLFGGTAMLLILFGFLVVFGFQLQPST